MTKNEKGMKNLKKIASAKNKSLTSLSVELEVSREAISQYISGKIRPKLSTIIKMSQILDTTTDYLLGITNNPNKTEFKLTEEENALLNKYQNLTEDEKLKVQAYIDVIIDLK